MRPEDIRIGAKLVCRRSTGQTFYVEVLEEPQQVAGGVRTDGEFPSLADGLPWMCRVRVENPPVIPAELDVPVDELDLA